MHIVDHSISIDGGDVEKVEDFCYLCIAFYLSNGSCDKKIQVRPGKAPNTFSRLFNIWSKERLRVTNAFRLHVPLILSTRPYMAQKRVHWLYGEYEETIEAEHHRWQRKIQGIKWKEMVRNDEVRGRSGQSRLKGIIRRRRLRTSSLNGRTSHITPINQALVTYIAEKKTRGRPRKKWTDAIDKHLEVIYMLHARVDSIDGAPVEMEKLHCARCTSIGKTKDYIRYKCLPHFRETAADTK